MGFYSKKSLTLTELECHLNDFDIFAHSVTRHIQFIKKIRYKDGMKSAINMIMYYCLCDNVSSKNIYL